MAEQELNDNGTPAMSPAIAKAIVEVMGGVKRLTKQDENKFAHYSYASIDAFLEAIGPLCASAGLFILSDEAALEITQAPKADREGTTNFLKLRWAFWLGHDSGAMYGPVYRTVIVPATGAQAFGSSQSYALKQFMRGLFQIPTGDNDDPDGQPKGNLPAGRWKNNSKGKGDSKKKTDGNGAGTSRQKASANSDAHRLIEEAAEKGDHERLLLLAERIRDSKELTKEQKPSLLAEVIEKLLAISNVQLGNCGTTAEADAKAEWWKKCWVILEDDRQQIAEGFRTVKQSLEATA